MKTMIHLRTMAIVALTAVAVTTWAQNGLKVNKVLRAQKMGGKTVLCSTDSRMAQTVVKFDYETDLNNMPQEVRDFLGSYEEALRRIDNGADPASVLSIDPAAPLTDVTVGPLLGTIEFDQITPYNNKCPIINNSRAITGCVATAMAEIMTFWKYPDVGKGSATYTGSSGAQTYNFADHPFDWNNILDTYKGGDYTNAQANAIAELMLACGASVNMNYNAAGSGTQSRNVAPALKEYFKYNSEIEYLHDASYELIETLWVSILKEEFDAGRPVYYAGSNQTSGHAFVIDGYKTEGATVYFHVNWGWNGAYNGWYLISNLKPQDVNYSSYSNDFICNINPYRTDIEKTPGETATKVDMNAPVYTVLGNKIPASGMQRGMIYIQNGRKFVW